tara:strand:+ start:4240 stop:4791 length:552 start_codon:yes stop_codon:yes gene_type:complete
MEQILNSCNENFERYDNIAILLVSTTNKELLAEYKPRIDNHNNSILNNNFADSGFDLLVPEETSLNNTPETIFIDFQIKSEMITLNTKTNTYQNTAYYMYPRSSLSKTPLMLSNHTGIIDSGYRGNLKGAFRNLKTEEYNVLKNTRLLQICHPMLYPVYVIIVNEHNLSLSERGTNGFGSTGR